MTDRRRPPPHGSAAGAKAKKRRGRREPWEYAGGGRRGSTKSAKLLPHWGDSHLWCPHCRKSFKYREMWAGLGRLGLTVWEAADLLRLSLPTVIAAAKTHGMQLALKGTQERNALEEIALRAGFGSARELLYQWLVKERRTYGAVARFIDMPVDEVKEACRLVFLLGEDPGKK